MELPPPKEDRWRAKDLTWQDIHVVIGSLLEEDTLLPPGPALVAGEFVRHLEARVLEPEVSLETLTDGNALVDAIAHELPNHFPGAACGPSRINRGSNYAGGVVIRVAPSTIQCRTRLFDVPC
jgi:hypothetical protein